MKNIQSVSKYILIVYDSVLLVSVKSLFIPERFYHLSHTCLHHKVLKGIEMELRECGYPQLHSVIVATDARVAFKDIDIAILLGAAPRIEGMDHKDLVSLNIYIFKVRALSSCSSRRSPGYTWSGALGPLQLQFRFALECLYSFLWVVVGYDHVSSLRDWNYL
jgi:hypothetical protein